MKEIRTPVHSIICILILRWNLNSGDYAKRINMAGCIVA
jgi:hypothetical protein